MFPQIASTAANFTRASSLVLRVGSDAHLYDDPHEADIACLLDSKFEAEKVEAMKRLLALMSQGCDVSNFFLQVVKNVASPSLEVKKLVYIYLVHYADKRPDEALLSINSVQKDLSDLNPLVRAWALRAISGIRVHVVTPLMFMAINKCVRDPSPYVRRCAANAIPKLHSLDREQYYDELVKLIGILLDDNSTGVVGAAASAFTRVCHEHLSMVASIFQKLCERLPDVEEWGQVVLMDILLRYVVARYGTVENIQQIGNFTRGDRKMDSEDSQKFTEGWTSSESGSESKDFKLARESRLLLQCTSPLLWSCNSAVVLAAASVHWLLSPKEETKKIVKPLIFLLRSSSDSQYVVLANLMTFIQSRPSLFESHYEEFFVRTSDIPRVRAMKLDILTLIANEKSIHSILQEFQAYIRDPNRLFAAEAVSAMGRCAKRLPSIALACVEGLLRLAKGGCSKLDQETGAEKLAMKVNVNRKCFTKEIHGGGLYIGGACSKNDKEEVVVIQAVWALRTLIHQCFSELEKVFIQLVCSLDHIKVPGARAVVIWMLGEYGARSSLLRGMLPTISQYLAARFQYEDVQTKLQILNSLSKVLMQSEMINSSVVVSLACKYVLELGSLDLSYDVRDRTRMLKKLATEAALQGVASDKMTFELTSQNGELSKSGGDQTLGGSSNFLARLKEKLFLTPKLTTPILPSLQSGLPTFLPGSMSHVVNHNAPEYKALPEPSSLVFVNPSSSEGKLVSEDIAPHPEHSDGVSDGYDDGFSSSGDEQEVQSEGGNTGNAYLEGSRRKIQSPSPGVAATTNGSKKENSQIGSSFDVGPLISFSDTEANEAKAGLLLNERERRMIGVQEEVGSNREGVRSAEDLESWLGAP